MDNEKKEDKFKWLKEHGDTITILAVFASTMLWMNGKFNEIEKDIAIIKTVLVIKKIMPNELATNEDKK